MMWDKILGDLGWISSSLRNYVKMSDSLTGLFAIKFADLSSQYSGKETLRDWCFEGLELTSPSHTNHRSHLKK